MQLLLVVFIRLQRFARIAHVAIRCACREGEHRHGADGTIFQLGSDGEQSWNDEGVIERVRKKIEKGERRAGLSTKAL